MTNKLVDGGDLEFFAERAEEAAKADPETEATIAKMVAAYRESLTPEQRAELDSDNAKLAAVMAEIRKNREGGK